MQTINHSPGTNALSAAELPKLLAEAFLSQRGQFFDGPGAKLKSFNADVELLVALRIEEDKLFSGLNGGVAEAAAACGTGSS